MIGVTVQSTARRSTERVAEEEVKAAEVPRIKHTTLHLTVQDEHAAPYHLLVSKPEDKWSLSADDLKGLKGEPRPPASQSKLTRRHQQYATSSPAAAAHRATSLLVGPNIFPYGRARAKFDATMMPVGFSECVSVTAGPTPRREESCVSFCDVETPTRCRSTLDVAPSLNSTNFKSRVVCYRDCTKKRFKSTANYVSKLKPLNYSDTYFVRPKHLALTFVSYVDYNPNDAKKWFSTSVELVPKTYSHNTVHNFQLRDRTRVGSFSSDDEGDDEEDMSVDDDVNISGGSGVNGSSEDDTLDSGYKGGARIHTTDRGDLNILTISYDNQPRRPPTYERDGNMNSAKPARRYPWMSSDDDDDSDVITHRSKLVVNSPYWPEHNNNEPLNDHDLMLYRLRNDPLGDDIAEV